MPRTSNIVRLSSRGQVVVPARVRRELGLGVGTPLRASTRGRNEIVFAVVPSERKDVEAILARARAWWRGQGGDPVEELHRRRRGERTQK